VNYLRKATVGTYTDPKYTPWAVGEISKIIIMSELSFIESIDPSVTGLKTKRLKQAMKRGTLL